MTNSSRTQQTVHENIDVSDTKLILGLRVCSISSDLTANKLFPIKPRAVTGPPKMSLLLEVESTSGLMIVPRLIIVTYTDDLGGYITSNQQGKMLVQNLHRIVRRPNVTQGQIPHCTTDCIPINSVFQENFPTNTQVRNSLCRRNDRRERRVKVKVKSSIAMSLPVENLLPQNVGSIINYLQ